jgi:hypothetical protein
MDAPVFILHHCVLRSVRTSQKISLSTIRSAVQRHGRTGLHTSSLRLAQRPHFAKNQSVYDQKRSATPWTHRSSYFIIASCAASALRKKSVCLRSEAQCNAMDAPVFIIHNSVERSSQGSGIGACTAMKASIFIIHTS